MFWHVISTLHLNSWCYIFSLVFAKRSTVCLLPVRIITVQYLHQIRHARFLFKGTASMFYSYCSALTAAAFFWCRKKVFVKILKSEKWSTAQNSTNVSIFWSPVIFSGSRNELNWLFLFRWYAVVRNRSELERRTGMRKVYLWSSVRYPPAHISITHGRKPGCRETSDPRMVRCPLWMVLQCTTLSADSSSQPRADSFPLKLDRLCKMSFPTRFQRIRGWGQPFFYSQPKNGFFSKHATSLQ